MSTKYNVVDIMLDMETLGLCDNCVIIQLSAVAFILDTGQILETFDTRINARSCVEKGFNIDGQTVEWWFRQSKEVFNDVVVTSLQLEENNIANDIVSTISDIDVVLNNFTTWIKKIKKDYCIIINMWSNGLLADVKWLRQAYKICNLEPCWHFTEDRDVRTLTNLGKRLFDYDYMKIKFEGVKHNALDDCRHQIKYCSEIYNKIIKNS